MQRLKAIQTSRRWLLVTVLLGSLGLGGWTLVSERQARRLEQAQRDEYLRRRGELLVRQGITLYQKRDFSGAIRSWEQYLRVAPPNSDTVSIREMILEATQASVDRPVGHPNMKESQQ